MIDIIINIMHLNFLIHLFTHLNLFVLIITNLGRVFTALFIVAMTFMEKYANIFFFLLKVVNYAIFRESTLHNWNPAKWAQITAISWLVGTKQERFASRDRTTPPWSSLRWDWSIAWNLSSLSSTFCPSFFLLGSLASHLHAPSPFPHSGPLFSICSTLRRMGLQLHVVRYLSLFPRSSSSLLSPSHSYFYFYFWLRFHPPQRYYHH